MDLATLVAALAAVGGASLEAAVASKRSTPVLEVLLKGLPILLAGVLGALTTLLGIHLQHKYDSKQRKRDRRADRQSKIYLGVAEALGEEDLFFGRILVPGAPIGDPPESLKVTYQAYLVISEETQSALEHAQRQRAESQIEAVEIRRGADEALSDLRYEEEMAAEWSRQSEQAAKASLTYAHASQWEQAKSLLDESKRLAEIAAKSRERLPDLRKASRVAVEATMMRGAELAEERQATLRPLLAAVRKDLGELGDLPKPTPESKEKLQEFAERVGRVVSPSSSQKG